MYKPGTQLIIDKLWAAAAAHELGFELESKILFSTSADTFVWTHGFIREADSWAITVTESGPNAAERFFPQDGDFIPFDRSKTILLRNGIPFPQFSEVIEP